jgi:hypothetical protein
MGWICIVRVIQILGSSIHGFGNAVKGLAALTLCGALRLKQA